MPEIKKVREIAANLRYKKEYIKHIKNVKQVLKHGLVFKNIHKVITFNQNDWLKSYINMNTDLRKKAKIDFEKDFFKLMRFSVFGKTMEKTKNKCQKT